MAYFVEYFKHYLIGVITVAIPDFSDKYFLPPGEHSCTLTEIEERFGSCNAQRRKVWSAFKRLLERKVELGLRPERALIDGSFCTGRELPGDVDAAILIRPDIIMAALNAADHHEKRAIMLILQGTRSSSVQNMLRDLFGAHILIADTDNTLDLWGDFFKQTRALDPDKDPSWVTKPRAKGILKVDMRGEASNAK